MKYGMEALSDGYRRFSINVLDLDKKVARMIIGSFTLYIRELLKDMEVGDEIILKGLGKFVKTKRKVTTSNLCMADKPVDGYYDCVRFLISPTLKKEIKGTYQWATEKLKSPYV